MIPEKMKEFLEEHLPETALKKRLKKENGKCFLEFDYTDELLLSRLGITRDGKTLYGRYKNVTGYYTI